MKLGKAAKRTTLKRIIPVRDWLINSTGCLIARWVLHNDDDLVIERKGGARQVIKVYSEPAYRNVIKPAIYKATEVIKVGDVVTDNGYHGKVVVTCIDYGTFKGYYLADGCLVYGLKLEDFKKIVSHIDLKIENS